MAMQSAAKFCIHYPGPGSEISNNFWMGSHCAVLREPAAILLQGKFIFYANKLSHGHEKLCEIVLLSNIFFRKSRFLINSKSVKPMSTRWSVKVPKISENMSSLSAINGKINRIAAGELIWITLLLLPPVAGMFAQCLPLYRSCMLRITYILLL